MLEYYAGRFQTVEINNSFYQLPERETLLEWRHATPGDFVFCVKASRYITHMKKLKDPAEPLSTFLKRVEALGDKLGVVLFQLPPKWSCNPERLGRFLEALPKTHRYAFEFRDSSWFDARVYQALTEHGAAFCIYHLAGRLSPKLVTSDFAYIRLHGLGAAYRGQYTIRALSGWVGAFSTWARQGKEVYCYFDNDEAGYAAKDALKLKNMIEK